MASSYNRFAEDRLPNSITSKADNVTPLDSNHPFSFIRWVEYNKILFTNIQDLLQRYQNYVTTWYESKNEVPVAESITIKDLYVNLLNEVIINYSSADERRFLKNIDTNNPRDLAIAVPFFANKIKDICLYYTTLRDKLPNTVVEYNLKGSNFGIESLIYNEISKTLEAQDLVDLIKSINLSVSSVRSNVIIDIEDIFDQYNSYLDVGTLPPSAYNSTNGIRAEYFDFNTNQIKPNLFIDFDSAIIDAIKAYPFYLIELGTNNFSINLNPTSTDLNYLKDSDFTNNINNQTSSNLSLNQQKALTTKYMGTDYYYISTGSTGTNFISGVLFEANNAFANFLNKNTPTVAAVPSLDYLYTAKNIGLFFKPDKIGLLTFSSFNFTYSLSSITLSANSLYIFPDPTKQGSVTGNTKQEQPSPLIFNDDANVLRADYTNSYKFGEVVNNPLLPTLRGYQSREQTLNYSNQGLSRYIDPQDFFAGVKRNTWANPDVYPLIPAIEYPIDQRLQALLTINNKTMTQFKSDVYGNNYGLYKAIRSPKNTQESINALVQSKLTTPYLIIDGYLFYDNAKGVNFNYSTDIPNPGYIYSGVTLKTTDNIPPGSGYYAPGPLSAVFDLYNNGAPSFYLSSVPAYIESYGLQPETFTSDYVRTSFDCNIRDGFTFVAANSALLVDFPSDNIDFIPNFTQVYYNILVDSGCNPAGPEFRANFANAGTFLFTVPLTGASYDCSYFVVSTFSTTDTPCQNVPTYDSELFLDNYFYNVLTPGSETTADTTVFEQIEDKTIYETNFATYGDFYFRNANSSEIAPVSAALSAVFLKFNSELTDEIFNKLINFDVYYDFLQLETENYLAFDKLQFNYATEQIRGSSTNELYVKRGSNKAFEKISTVWFNETNNELIFATTTLHPTASTTNFKTVYPKLFVLKLNDAVLTQIYPTNEITFNQLLDFSLSGTNINIEIVSIDKPLMTYSSETGLYSLTYVARDTSNLFYMFVTTFKYLNGILSNITNIMYKPDMNTVHNNFNNPSNYLSYYTYATLGNAGSIVGGEFIFGA